MMTHLKSGLGASLVLALAFCSSPAWAQAPAPALPAPALPAQAAPVAATKGETLIDALSRGVFDFNAGVVSWATWAGAQTGFSGSPASAGLARMFYNLVVEPISAVSHFATGEFEKALVNLRRFTINTTYGIAGVYDRAEELGLKRETADLGLALCKAGVPEGPYIVAPLMGPRTTRDAIADYLSSSMITNAVFSPVVYGGLLDIDGAALRFAVDEATALTAARQLDPAAQGATGSDYIATRDAYLAERRKRCAAQG